MSERTVSVNPEDFGMTHAQLRVFAREHKIRTNPAAKTRPCKSCNKQLHKGNLTRIPKTRDIDGNVTKWDYPRYCNKCYPAVMGNRRDSLILENDLVDVPRDILVTGGVQLPPSGDINSEGMKRAREKEKNPNYDEEMVTVPADEVELIKRQLEKIHEGVTIKKLNPETGLVEDIVNESDEEE